MNKNEAKLREMADTVKSIMNDPESMKRLVELDNDGSITNLLDRLDSTLDELKKLY